MTVCFIVREDCTDQGVKHNETMNKRNKITTETRSERPTMVCTGTAFFISEHLLLTAGHTVGAKGTKVYGVEPGFEAQEINAYDVLKGINLEACRYTFEVVDRIFEQSQSDYLDLAILKIDSVHFPRPVSVDFMIQATEGTPVDVIGYPSNYNEHWIKGNHDQVTNVAVAFRDVLDLLPKWRVVASTGEIISVDENNIRYRLSTAPGMSGAVVLYAGKAIGTIEHQCG
jgi:V8-like Glu-specific endopeptidase